MFVTRFFYAVPADFPKSPLKHMKGRANEEQHNGRKTLPAIGLLNTHTHTHTHTPIYKLHPQLV